MACRRLGNKTGWASAGGPSGVPGRERKRDSGAGACCSSGPVQHVGCNHARIVSDRDVTTFVPSIKIHIGNERPQIMAEQPILHSSDQCMSGAKCMSA